MKVIGRFLVCMNRLTLAMLLSVSAIGVFVFGISTVHAANSGYGSLYLQAGRTSF